MDDTTTPATATQHDSAVRRDCRCCNQADAVALVATTASTKVWRCGTCGATWTANTAP